MYVTRSNGSVKGPFEVMVPTYLLHGKINSFDQLPENRIENVYVKNKNKVNNNWCIPSSKIDLIYFYFST